MRVERRRFDEGSGLREEPHSVAAQRQPEESNIAGIRSDEVQKEPNRRRLAGPVWTEKAVDATPRHLKAQIIPGDESANALGETVRLNGKRLQ